MNSLVNKKCVPCEGDIPPLGDEEIKDLMSQVQGWDLEHERSHPQISKTYKFENFKEAVVFVNKVADIAESEGHHPNIQINYNKVRLSNYTHAIGGLHENDFILAAKIDSL